MKSPDWDDLIQSDQDKKLPQPALFNQPKGTERIELPKDFESLKLEDNFYSLLDGRKSRRIYNEKSISLLELSFLLWASLGVKGRRGKSYATLRTVPSGGARHGYESYVDAMKVDGLKSGVYHYLAEDHALEWVNDQTSENRTASVSGQKWVGKAAALFYFTAVPYRFEWRYTIYAHKIALVDLGHIGENLYLAAEALKLGTCGIGAYGQEICDELLKVDGENEFTVYVQPVGRMTDRNKSEEKEFYSFVEEENL
ncbi:MAG: SagB/ThcOx family dehydrogenase [Tissierellia bacterium]|nr:SagB/ThcOx family dehydrogenase [Tissierellia bacterium]